MNQLTMEKDKELTALKKKLESMIKLNKTLGTERADLIAKVKKQVLFKGNVSRNIHIYSLGKLGFCDP